MSSFLHQIRNIILLLILGLTLEAQEKNPFIKRTNQPVLQKTYQVIIIGGGPSGLSCGQRCAKYGFSTLVINTAPDKNPQSVLIVPNWPGLPNNSWNQIIDLLKTEFTKSGGTYFEGECTFITKSQNFFTIALDKDLLNCDICVIATGKTPTMPECKIIPPSSSRTLMRFYNPDFIGPKDTVSLIGDDEHTLQIALEIAGVANKVFILSHTANLDVNASSMQALQEAPNVKFISYDRLLGITNQAKNCLVEYSKANSKFIQSSSWAIFSDLLPPQSEIAGRVTQIDSKGAVVTCDTSGSTHTRGFYACGEVSCNEFLPGAFAASAGARTGARICRELLENGVTPILRPKLKIEEITVEPEKEAPSSTK